MMSRERLDSTRRAWQSLLNSKDYSFVYEDTPEDALKIMEAIYNREAIVLPHVKMDIPKLVE